MLARIAFAFVFTFSASIAFAEDNFGACDGEARFLLSRGGVTEKVLSAKFDPLKMNVTYTHQYGSVEVSVVLDWEKVKTPDNRAKIIAYTLSEMNDENAAIRAGTFWYVVVNRAIFAPQGVAAFNKPEERDTWTKLTKWRSYSMYVHNNECLWGPLDWTVFEEDLPEAIRDRLH